VSFSAHAGGFVAGVLVATLLMLWTHSPELEQRRAWGAKVVLGALCLVCVVWSAAGTVSSLSRPISAVIPFEPKTLTLVDGVGRASLRLERPATWQVKERKAPYQAQLGPRIVGFSGQLITTRVVCRADLPSALNQAKDMDALIRALNRSETGNFEQGPLGYALLRQPKNDGVTLTAVKLTPLGMIKQHYFVESRGANGEALVERMLSTVELLDCQPVNP
ncbi:MAG: hypothetical protein AAFX99_30620, partial [Myxococcota bacterium]